MRRACGGVPWATVHEVQQPPQAREWALPQLRAPRSRALPTSYPYVFRNPKTSLIAPSTSSFSSVVGVREWGARKRGANARHPRPRHRPCLNHGPRTPSWRHGSSTKHFCVLGFSCSRGTHAAASVEASDADTENETDLRADDIVRASPGGAARLALIMRSATSWLQPLGSPTPGRASFS